MPNGSDIIIKGGSVEVEFDGSVYKPEGKKHKNKDLKLTQVVITDEGGVVRFDSGEDNKGLNWTIRAFAKK